VNYHLVILKKPYLEAILDGRKPVESRFWKTRRYPFGRVLPGDFENLTPEQIIEIKQQYNHLIGGADEHWQKRADCKFGFLVWLKDVRTIKPVRIHKKDWRAWVVLTEKQNFGLLKNGAAIKHNK
jgi:hypothetical protein